LAKSISEPRIVDVGTGSGAIAVALAKQHKGARITATDISPAALAVAQHNAEKHGVSDRIRFVQGDLLAPFSADEQFDLIVSNPPYIPHDEIARLPVGVRDYEPHTALDGGPDGFAVFERLIEHARDHLSPAGWLILEIGSPQEVEARRRLVARGYHVGKPILDGSGHPRVLAARWNPSARD
jgi:release factor glutamine methyltransferase